MYTTLTSKTTFLEKHDLFGVLTDAERALVAEHSRSLRVAKHQFAYFVGDPVAQLFVLQRGLVKCSRYAGNGREVIMDIVREGETFGEAALVNTRHREDTATALDDCLLSSIRLEVLHALMAQNPSFSLRMVTLLGQRLQRLQRRLERLSFVDADHRIRYFLREQAQRHGRRVGHEIYLALGLTHDDIGKATATSRQTVTGIFNELEKRGIITYNRKSILIRAFDAL